MRKRRPQDKEEAADVFIGTPEMEVHAKVIEYEHFLNERLRSDLNKVCSLNTKACWDSQACWSCWDRHVGGG